MDNRCCCRGSHRTTVTVRIILVLFILLAVIAAFLFAIRALVGGDEDDWLCVNSTWVRHGNPSVPMPAARCGSAPIVRLFFQNIQRMPDDCSAVYSVSRAWESGLPTVEGVLAELFKGPTPEENKDGFSSAFLGNTVPVLKRAFLKDGIVYVDLNDIRFSYSAISASCGSAALFSSVKETLRAFYKFPEPPTVRFAINGSPALFYEWVQLGCSPKEGNCDPRPFSDT